MKPEKSRIKSDILLRVRLLYILFILAGLLIFARLVWVQLFSSEVAYNAERLAGRIFTEQIIPAQRGNILTRGRRSAGHLDLPLPRRSSISAARGSIRAYVPRTERLAVQTTCRLFRRQIRSRIPSHVPHAACQTLPGKIPQGHPRSPLRRTHRPLDRPDFGPGIRAEKTLRYPARPHSRPNLSPRHRLHRMGNPAQIPAPELEHGHGLQPA